MSKFCPHYPKPQTSKLGMWRAFFGARRSWIDTLYERSYAMQMGEVQLPGSKLFMVNDPICVHRVMNEKSQEYVKHSLLHEALLPLLGESIFTTHGTQWQRQRQMMTPSFAQTRINVAFGHMQAAVESMLQRIRAWDFSRPHDVQEEMTLTAADIIFRTIFSQGINEGNARSIFEAFTRYQNIAPKLMLPALFGMRWLVPWGARRQSLDAAQTIRQSLNQMIMPRMQEHAHRSAQPGYVAVDILDSLLDARDEKTGAAFDAEELLNQVAMLFLAGHETSASALAWSLHLLSNSPDIQDRMRLEWREALQDQALSAERLRDLPLTWNVFREALRLFPPVGFIARQAMQPDVMRDKKIKVNDSVVISPWLIQRHRQFWTSPDIFDPDRFDAAVGSPERQALRDAYLPFGAGPRVCIGASFAMQEAIMVLSHLVKHFSFLPHPTHVPQPVGRLTVRSENGILMFLKPLETSK